MARKQLFFRRQLRFAFGSYLTNQNVAGIYLGTDIDDAGLIQLAQRALSHVRDIGSDLF